MSDERRIDNRIPAVVPVRMKFDGVDDFLKAYTEDISLGGIFIPTAIEVQPGTPVELTLELEEGKGFLVQARVAWWRPGEGMLPSGAGLSFGQMSAERRRWLDAAVKKFIGTARPRAADAPRFQLRRPQAHSELDDARLDVGSIAKVSNSASSQLTLGIDLGTSSTAACLYKGGEPIVLDLSGDGNVGENSKSIPSVVAFDGAGGVSVGRDALEGLDRNPKRTIYGAKRFVGRQYENPIVQSLLDQYPYRVVKGKEGECAVEINGRPVSLATISSKLLSFVRDVALNSPEVNLPVLNAVITVPAYYNQNQRNAVVQAGRLAGLTVDRIVNEPTAAAIAYGVTYDKPQRLLVYDLGGGTFDVSLMSVGDGKLTVMSTAGDTFLGGEDFDNAIVRYAMETHEKATGERLSRNHTSLARIRIVAESAKRRLSMHERSMVTVRNAILIDGTPTRMEIELSRAKLEELVRPLVQRTLKICDMALAETRLRPGDVTDIILVGGQTLMPLVQAEVERHFGRPPKQTMRADEVVALGAARLSQLGQEQLGELQDVLSMSIGIATADKRLKPLIKRNTPLPHTSTFTLDVPKARFPSFSLEVYQGDDPVLIRCEYLGMLSLGHLFAGDDDPVQLKLDFTLSADCLLSLRVTNLGTGEATDALLETR